MKCAVIFGGSGFVGVFFAKHLIEQKEYNKVYLLDIEDVASKKVPFRSEVLRKYSEIQEIYCDVRRVLISIIPRILILLQILQLYTESLVMKVLNILKQILRELKMLPDLQSK